MSSYFSFTVDGAWGTVVRQRLQRVFGVVPLLPCVVVCIHFVSPDLPHAHLALVVRGRIRLCVFVRYGRKTQ